MSDKNNYKKNQLTWPYTLVFYYIPFNVFWDLLSLFYEGPASFLALIRGIILLVFFIIMTNKLKKSSITNSVLFFIIYIILLFAFASDLKYSINVSSKIFMTLFMLPIGYSLIRSKYTMDRLNKKIYFFYWIIILGFGIYNIADVGGYSYIDIGFDAGGLRGSWNLLTYSLLLAPLYFKSGQKSIKNQIFKLLFISLLIILLISFKRIAVLGLALGYLIFLYNYSQHKKALKNIMLIAIGLIILSPIYIDSLYKKYEARQARFEKGFLESETRYKETISIWDEMLSFEKPAKSLFGGEAFNSVRKYAGARFGERMSHVDYNLILISNGFIGLLLYLNIYLQVFRKYKKCINIFNIKKYNIYKSIFWSLFLTSLFTSLSGQMYSITFRSIIFLYLGAILGFVSNQEYKIKKIM